MKSHNSIKKQFARLETRIKESGKLVSWLKKNLIGTGKLTYVLNKISRDMLPHISILVTTVPISKKQE